MIRWIMRVLRGGNGTRTPGQQAAVAASARIEAAQEEAERRQPEVTQQAGLFRGLRRENHFREMFENALRGGHG